jgi:hypothetical protein
MNLIEIVERKLNKFFFYIKIDSFSLFFILLYFFKKNNIYKDLFIFFIFYIIIIKNLFIFLF